MKSIELGLQVADRTHASVDLEVLIQDVAEKVTIYFYQLRFFGCPDARGPRPQIALKECLVTKHRNWLDPG